MRLQLAVAAWTMIGCASRRQPPPELPPPPTAIAPGTSGVPTTPETAENDSAPRHAEPAASTTALPPRPQPTGDREHDTLAIGVWGCRVLAQRIAPQSSGKAVLRVRLGSNGDVLALSVWNMGVAHPVVQCLVDAVRATHFDPRGGNGAELEVPIDLSRPDIPSSGTSPPAGTVSM